MDQELSRTTVCPDMRGQAPVPIGFKQHVTISARVPESVDSEVVAGEGHARNFNYSGFAIIEYLSPNQRCFMETPATLSIL